MLPVNAARIKHLYQQAMAAQQAGNAPEALRLYAQVLQMRPDLAEAHFQIGRIHAAAKQADKAEAALRKALKSRPKEPAIWQALAGVLSGGKLKKLRREAASAGISLSTAPDISSLLAQIDSGGAEAAEAAAFALVARHPQAAGPALALGLARAAQGKWGKAFGPLEKAVERDPENPRALVALGEARAELGQWLRAEQDLRRAAALGADTARPLARVLRETCRPEEAEALLAKAAQKHRKWPRLYLDLGDTRAILRRPRAARAAYDRAIALGARPIVLAELADKLAAEGEHAAGAGLVEELLRADPDNPDLIRLRGQQRQTAGDFDGARADLMRVLDLTRDGAEAIRSYVAGGKVAPDDPILPILEARLADLTLPRASRRVLSFAMAKALEDQGEHDRVFAHLNRANRLMREEFPYSFDTDLANARALATGYTAVRGLEHRGPFSDERPLFVSGLPRSGTTLVETILAAHSRVTAGGEMSAIVQALHLPVEQAALDPAALGAGFAEAGQRYIRAARRQSGAADLFTDKAIATFSRIGPAAIALPEARFLMLRRDPRDVGLSIYRNMFPAGTQRYTTDLTDIGRFIRLYDAMQEIWAEALPDRVHVVDYDALTGEPEPHVRALVAAAGIDWEDACLSPHKAERRVETLSFAQVRQPIYRSSVAAWKRYEDDLAPLLEALEKPVVL
ncbi:MAG: hypothetical protein COW55_03010 [Rhodobacteraceae bacterium CG17_big_fil_post_rev_8_21_14_2_50_65_11]|nr:MAG: hypothetical protein COW55_03010 [Rhodobacteraceae bacterium CG17_big_fil_post_rev_8_21_14_2_50_65_11]